MRLHLSIQRHELPAVDIVFSTNTGTRTQRNSATIADLLQDVNALVPLESPDGEWALEDYVVELSGKKKYGVNKRQRWYECLHFQPLVTVLRDDDEIVVRAKEPDDLRTRRIGAGVRIDTSYSQAVDGVTAGQLLIAAESQKRKRPERFETDHLPIKKRKLLSVEDHDGRSSLVSLAKQLDDEDTTSSSGDSDSDSDADSDSDSDIDSQSKDGSHSSSSSIVESDYTSSSGSDLSSESDSSSSDESEVEVKETSKNIAPAVQAKSSTKFGILHERSPPLNPATSQPRDKSPQAPKQNPPGQGLTRTKKKNERVRMKKKLQALQASGQLPENATFNDLREYEKAQQTLPTDDADLAEELNVAKARLLKSIEEMEVETPLVEATEMHSTAGDAGHITKSGISPQSDDVSPEGQTIFSTATTSQKKSSHHQSTTEVDSTEADNPSPMKRVKLNIAASRRLLFGSLGLRTPKNAAEEQALRNQLSQNIGPGRINRPKESSRRETLSSNTGQKAGSNSWKEKLVVTAIECVREDLILPPPPFPFVQHWHREENTEKAQDDLTLNYDESVSPPSEQQTGKFKTSNGYTSHVGTNSGNVQQDDTVMSESRTVSFEKDTDGIPIPTNFEHLADLNRQEAHAGTVIAYKELEVGIETNFQPQISAYRVAMIESVNNKDWVTLRVSKSDRRKKSHLDPETGEEIPNNFEIIGDQDDVDDGLREMEWGYLLEPKLVQARESRVQVQSSPAKPDNTEDDHQDHSEQKSDSGGVIPESLHVNYEGEKAREKTSDAVQIDIGTPRRKEISKMIQDAGFHSAMDQHLLGPLLGDGNSPSVGLSEPVSVPADSIVETSKVEIGGEEIGHSAWISTPIEPGSPDAESDGHGMESARDKVPSFEPYSSPSVSLQLTVEYPRVSLLEGDETSTPREGYTRNSSSHQDAQRVAPLPPAVPGFETTSVDEVGSAVSEGAAEVQAVGHNLESLSSHGVTRPSQDDPQEEHENMSFLGRHGSDGPDSSYLRSEGKVDGNSDDSSLPSLSAIISGQRPRQRETKGRKKMSSLLRKKQSGVKVSTKPSKDRTKSGSGGATEDEEVRRPEPESSQVDFKISASQAEPAKSLGEIQPHGILTIDLTQTSSPASPGNNDSEFVPPRKARATSGESRRRTRGSWKTSDDDQSSHGMGTKRLLTTKKKKAKAGGYF